MMAELSANHAAEGSFVYDLGCSTGTTMIGMNTMVSQQIRFIGIDDSQEMLDKCKSKLMELGFSRPYELRCADLAHGVKIENASVVVLCLTLQFVRPIYREKVLKDIYDGLNPGGVLILVEKILAEESNFNRDFIDYYYNYKRRNNYSEMEISHPVQRLQTIGAVNKYAVGRGNCKNHVVRLFEKSIFRVFFLEQQWAKLAYQDRLFVCLNAE